MTSTRFNAPLGREVIILTSIVTMIVVILMVYIWSRGGRFIPAVLLVIHLLPLILSVRGYKVVPGALLIRRLWWDTRWPLDGQVKASVRPGVMSRSLRLFGNGGVFAFSGTFRNDALGSYRAFVTDFNRTVVIDTPRGVVVVSPDRPADFVAAVQRAAGPR